jgi:hypothetical protein
VITSPLSSPLSKGDGSFTPHALAKIEGVFQLYDRDQDGMWDVAEWNDVSTALGEDGKTPSFLFFFLLLSSLSSFFPLVLLSFFPSFLASFLAS